jgi:hypothetical protein
MANTNWNKGLVPSLLAVALAACGGGSGEDEDGWAGSPHWPPIDHPAIVPFSGPTTECEIVSGPPVVTYSLNGGEDFAIHETPPVPGLEPGTQSVVAKPASSTWGWMMASRGTGVYQSLDGGCSWQHLLSSAEHLELFAPRYPDAHIFGLGDRGDTLHIFSSQFGQADATNMTLPFHAIDIAPTRWSTMYALASDGRIFRLRYSWSQGYAGWESITAISGGSPTGLAVNPTGHTPFEPPLSLIVSMASGPPMVSVDGGTSWAAAEGVAADSEIVVTSRAHFTSALNNRDAATEVWLVVRRQRTDPGSGAVLEERALMRSTDSGRSFNEVLVADGNSVLLEDALLAGRLLITRPGTPGEVMFPASGCPNSEPRLYRYDIATDTIDVLNWPESGIYGIGSLMMEAGVVYLGHHAPASCD